MLSSIFARFGAPKQIVSDNGRQFISEEFQTFCNLNGIEHLRTSPYNPMSNGQAERFVDTFKRSMKKLEGEGNIDEILDTFLKIYRSTPNVNCPSQNSPAETLLGRKMRTIFDLLKPTPPSVTIRNKKMEDQYNKRTGATQREFNIDDSVYVQIHQNNSWRWEGVIIDKIGEVNYEISTNNRNIKAHANKIKLFFFSSI